MATVAQSNERRSSRHPPLTQTDAITSLLSLSLAAAGATAASGASTTTPESTTPKGLNAASTTSIVPTVVPAAGGKHHRRLSSQGKARRRLSDAREASARPLLVPSASSSGSLSLAALSLSTSPPSGHNPSQSLGQAAYAYPPVAIKPRPTSYTQGISIISASAPNGTSILATNEDDSALADDADDDQNDSKGSAPISVGSGKAKKRGVDYVCESCSKIYRHPNCLNKHRWEHTRQWREASKFVLSKHQQVQLLEAATILSFMGTPSTSLPEDRSEWPSFLSGGSLPKVDPITGAATTGNPTSASSEHNTHMAASAPYGSHMGHAQYPSAANVPRTTSTYALHPHHISSSVPNVSSGPRMHDYALPAASAATKVTQVRPGLLGVPNAPPANGSPNGHTIIGPNGAGVHSGAAGWSHANSSLRSASYGAGPGSLSSSRSRSASVSRSRSRSGSDSRSDESIDADVDVEGEGDPVRGSHSIMIAKSTPNIGYSGYPSMTPVGLSHSPGYGYAGGGYGTNGHVTGYGYSGHSFGRRGMGMKREEDEMSVGFSVREEDEDEEEEAYPATRTQPENKWNGMEMEMEMDMD